MLVTLVKDLHDTRTSVTVMDEVHLPNTAVNTGDKTPQGWAIWSIVPEHIAKFGKKVEAELGTLEAAAGNTVNTAHLEVLAETAANTVTAEVEKIVTEAETEVKKIADEVEQKVEGYVFKLEDMLRNKHSS